MVSVSQNHAPQSLAREGINCNAVGDTTGVTFDVFTCSDVLGIFPEVAGLDIGDVVVT
jgi:2-polyprenyl-3-methyl-5-hydroxy-6-metoxy-1,4-benzoquinol methylase